MTWHFAEKEKREKKKEGEKEEKKGRKKKGEEKERRGKIAPQRRFFDNFR